MLIIIIHQYYASLLLFINIFCISVNASHIIMCSHQAANLHGSKGHWCLSHMLCRAQQTFGTWRTDTGSFTLQWSSMIFHIPLSRPKPVPPLSWLCFRGIFAESKHFMEVESKGKAAPATRNGLTLTPSIILGEQESLLPFVIFLYSRLWWYV